MYEYKSMDQLRVRLSSIYDRLDELSYQMSRISTELNNSDLNKYDSVKKASIVAEYNDISSEIENLITEESILRDHLMNAIKTNSSRVH